MPRLICACLLAFLAIVAAAPPTLLRANAGLHQALAAVGGWWLLPLLIAIVLIAAGLLLPAAEEDAPAAQRLRRDRSMLGVGILLFAEPLLHLLLLWWMGQASNQDYTQAVLPPPWRLREGGLLGQALVLSLAMPLAEEFFFRGRLLPLLRRRLGGLSAVSLSAGLFACAHTDPAQVLLALPLGLWLGWLRLHGRDLGACVLTHQVHNGLFLVAGPALVSSPRTALVLTAMGALLIGLGLCLQAGRPRLVAAAWSLVLLIAAAAGMPLLHGAQSRLWVTAAHRAFIGGFLLDAPFALRLERLRQIGRLDDGRDRALAAAIAAQPHRRAERNAWALAILDPARLLPPAGPEADDQAGETLLTLARFPDHCPAMGQAARLLMARHPLAALRVAREAEELLPAWLPLPAYQAEAAAILDALPGGQRRRWLAALDRGQPQAVAGVVLALPAERTRPMDISFLRRGYEAGRLAGLFSAAGRSPVLEAGGVPFPEDAADPASSDGVLP